MMSFLLVFQANFAGYVLGFWMDGLASGMLLV
jgi:hypothetical protein